MLIDNALELHWNEPVHKTFYKAIAQFNVQSGQRDSLSEGNLFVFFCLVNKIVILRWKLDGVFLRIKCLQRFSRGLEACARSSAIRREKTNRKWFVSKSAECGKMADGSRNCWSKRKLVEKHRTGKHLLRWLEANFMCEICKSCVYWSETWRKF